MADSDYSVDGEDPSDDEYVGPRGGSSTRAQAAGKKKAQAKVPEKLRQRKAWENEHSEAAPAATEEAKEPDEDIVETNIQLIEEDRKRKR